MNLELFLAKVNKVTAYHRHGQEIPRRALDDLANAQIEMEQQTKNGFALMSLYQQAINRIEDYLEYQYLNDRPDAMKTVIMGFIDGLAEKLKTGHRPEPPTCAACGHDLRCPNKCHSKDSPHGIVVI